MTKISIVYPHNASARFDFDYYTRKHMPRSIELLSSHPGFRAVSVERGVGGMVQGSPPRYTAACFYTFDTLDSFLAAFLPHANELQEDMPHYTDIAPEIQINEIIIDTWPEA